VRRVARRVNNPSLFGFRLRRGLVIERPPWELWLILRHGHGEWELMAGRNLVPKFHSTINWGFNFARHERQDG
jgi:hypothetical protein